MTWSWALAETTASRPAGDVVPDGGTGSDTMTGGAGADCFVVRSAGDSATDSEDLILDFVSGVDAIGLFGVDADPMTTGDQAFAFIGSAPFGGTAGELRLTVSAPLAVLRADLDGDGAADFAIRFDLAQSSAPELAVLILRRHAQRLGAAHRTGTIAGDDSLPDRRCDHCGPWSIPGAGQMRMLRLARLLRGNSRAWPADIASQGRAG